MIQHGSGYLRDESSSLYGVRHTNNRPHYIPYVWDTDTLSYVAMTQPLLKTDELSVSGEMQLVDENGTAYGVKHVNNKPRVSAMPYTYDIAEGNVTNHTTWSKIGINLAVGATEEDMWPLSTAYTFPASELTMTLESDSADDTAEGTGARTVTVYWLDDGFTEKSATVTLSGSTPVAVGSDVYRVQNMRVATTGTGLVPAGNLSLKSGATTYGYISAGRTRQRLCTWTVPTGKVLFVTQISFSCSDQAAGKYCRFTTKANYDDKAGSILQRGLWMPYNEVTLNNTAYTRELNPPTKLSATVDLKVSAVANSACAATCSLRGWVENA